MAQLGMFRAASRGFIRIIEKLLFELLDDVIYLSAPRADDEWSELGNGFAARGADFPDFACVFDGTRIRTRRPRDHQGFYDWHQSKWNQSVVLGAKARDLCPPNVNWLGDVGSKLWLFLMMPSDERSGQRLTRKLRCYNYHLSQTRIIVDRVFGKIKARFKCCMV
ncbi:DDE superfamily endonuclease [Phytophthora infestans]|uniref:DDE superfamily endonuclease n=1 Tax=Phytophthora infestans TaxID=4787 RepID=A0A8S9TXL9_PHYIN|nr:DDE superfamily endonuclease [Phytophthora infestans]